MTNAYYVFYLSSFENGFLCVPRSLPKSRGNLDLREIEQKCIMHTVFYDFVLFRNLTKSTGNLELREIERK